MPDEYITRKEFEAFLEELSVVLADFGISPRFAWEHYNRKIYKIKDKENLIRKGGDIK